MSATLNIYPPVIDTYMPAKITGNALTVHFSISDYNDIEDIVNAQVTISDQESNLSVLDRTKYPSQIMLKAISVETDPAYEGDDKYYITIAPTDGTFDIDKFYKVQIRFTTEDALPIPIDWEDPTVPQAIDNWLAVNLDNFSEWSRVTLIKWIANNYIMIEGQSLSQTISISKSKLELTGVLKFTDGTNDISTKEYLNSYRIQIKSGNTILVDSGLLYTDKQSNNPNEFWYKLKYILDAGNYTLIVNYQTNSLYKTSVSGTLTITGDSGVDQGFTFSAKENQEEGQITTRISRTAKTAFTGKVIIKRSSDDTNFTIWEDMHTFGINAQTSVIYDWVDNTVESGKLYKYALLESYTSNNEEKTYLKEYNKILMLVLEDMYLTIANKQLKIEFNPQVSSFKQVVNEGKIETIGSPYPYIRRNAAINYAQFPISGLISCQMDENENFISKEDLYGGRELLRKYEQFNSYSINEPFETTINNDFVYEKKFRDEVIKYLMDGKTKLFRSPTEGNYLVRLTDVSFSPNQQLGRMIWTFSATANEIAANTVDNYYKYKILEEYKPSE